MGAHDAEVTESESSIPAKDRFQFLFTQSAELAKALPTYQFQFSAALVIVLGWLLTSEDATKFVRVNAVPARIGSVVLVTCLVLFHSLWLLRHVRRANRLHRELTRFAKLTFPDSEALVDSVSIDRFLPWSYVIVNLLICGAILTVCWSLAGHGPQTP